MKGGPGERTLPASAPGQTRIDFKDMTQSAIHFFTPQDNAPDGPVKTNEKSPQLRGYISSSGKLTLPLSTLEQLGLAHSAFLVGTDAGKRRIKTLYLIPAEPGEPETFTMSQGAKSRFIELGPLLRNNGLDFGATKYSFSVSPFTYEGQSAYALALREEKAADAQQPKAPYMGKPRGRRKKGQ
ncbi:hypothetical protein [Fibrella forsythiae]|uniref:Copper amine oxidase-like N-terminal domain-containing protein n=1 Tax=Fibrella forsythiae TaxID=2817061 RepID=A0ABS3JTH5_9BACT|nr:hypothetical protein [Fibrella forsythiae]MBO0953316.1 hypothetical protein [Fibrella forsythiae]